MRHPVRQAALALALVVPALGALPAHAAYPGRDGRVVATFASHGGTAITTVAMHPDGTHRHALRGPQALLNISWSRSGRELAALDDGNAVIAGAHGHVLRRLRVPWAGRPDSLPNPTGVALSPNGRRVALVQTYFHPNCCEEEADTRIWIARADGTGRARILAHGYDPQWAPDGRSLYYYRLGATWDTYLGIGRIRADGTHSHGLGFDEDTGLLDVAPSGRRLLVEGVPPHPGSRGSGPRFCLWSVRPTGGRATCLTEEHGIRAIDGAFSPSGRSVVFARSTEQRDRGLFVQPASDDHATRIGSRSAGYFEVSWAPRLG